MRAGSQAIRPFGLEAPKQRRNKFNVAPASERTVDGIVFASKAESRRYAELKLLEKAGFIRNLELQPKFEFKLNADGKVLFRYLADFRYFEGATRVVEDVKGMQTDLFRLKRKIIEAAFHVKITIVK